MQIPVVDIFAGPGGLGEGFSAFSQSTASNSRPFRIAVSAEMEENAARTLRLRAFFRRFQDGHAPSSYYEYVAGRASVPWDAASKAEWIAAGREALQLTLGNSVDDSDLYARIREIDRQNQAWVLIGGPPCQAYSLAGRSRNRGIKGYTAEADQRHFLYEHYLTILRKFQPAAFIMENVKGILSSKVHSELVFPRIIDDLSEPGGPRGPRYRIIPLVLPRGESLLDVDGTSYILRAEELGVPQARHRVVLLGLAEGTCPAVGSRIAPSETGISVASAIGGLPKLRSGVTDTHVGTWRDFARDLLRSTARVSTDAQVSKLLRKASDSLGSRDPGIGGRWQPKTAKSDQVPRHLESWLVDKRLDGILNHEVREHMSGDLMRYAFVSAFGAVHGRSPRGARQFPPALHPDHKNWKSGVAFIDRFKVQCFDRPSSTITSHLSKDGHYFIHPDPCQLRSLSVREAARLQTFPDNYFFEGSRVAQFRQVGNAVPPWMAQQIAGVVYSYLTSRGQRGIST